MLAEDHIAIFEEEEETETIQMLPVSTYNPYYIGLLWYRQHILYIRIHHLLFQETIPAGSIYNQLTAGFLKRLKIPVCSINLVMVKKIKESIGHMIKFFTVRIGRIARKPFP